MKVKIALAMIVKDDKEVKMLEDCLNSVQQYVDATFITATGKPVRKIQELCKKRGMGYSYFKWVGDFSKARNFNFSQVPDGFDFILWLDADDIFVAGEDLRKVAQEAKDNGHDTVFFTYWYGCSFDGEPTLKNMVAVDMQHIRERLLKPGTSIWKKRLHETPVPIEGHKNQNANYSYEPKEGRKIAVMHTEDGSRLDMKMNRNKELLEDDLREERKRKGADPRTLLYLMKIYAGQDVPKNWDECIKMGEEYLKKSGWDEERGVCWEQMAISWGRKNNQKRAIECLHAAIEEWPFQPMFYLRLATGYYNAERHRQAQHWLDVGMGMNLDDFSGSMINFKEMKTMSMELKVRLQYNVYKDPDGALSAARILYKENPDQKNQENLIFLEDMKDFNDNCKKLDGFLYYLKDIGADKNISSVIEALPTTLSEQPFIISHVKRQIKPRKWKKNEICYFANFGNKHFEKWDENSLKTGIGGSETAVIRLSEEWAKLGYKITVYGDPEKKHTTNGVTWLPWYYFNPKDKFNIFIQWRNPYLAGKVKARKYFVDLHDIFSGIDYSEKLLASIDGVNVKSKYHRELAPKIKNINIISNGI